MPVFSSTIKGTWNLPVLSNIASRFFDPLEQPTTLCGAVGWVFQIIPTHTQQYLSKILMGISWVQIRLPPGLRPEKKEESREKGPWYVCHPHPPAPSQIKRCHFSSHSSPAKPTIANYSLVPKAAPPSNSITLSILKQTNS